MIQLTDKEQAFLRRLIAQHLAYYEVLALHSNCSQNNRDQHLFIGALWEKLQPNNTSEPPKIIYD